MGQTLGRAPLPKGCERFINLPRSCIYDLWDSFNDIAEGFGLSIEEFHDIIKSALLEYLGVTERVLNMDTDKLFRVFDNDEVTNLYDLLTLSVKLYFSLINQKNNLVDSLEFLSSFAILSGMNPEEKIRFIFAMYDFDESCMLTLDEMVLAFRSTLSGLSKLSKIDPPLESEVESIVVQAFESIKKQSSSNSDDNFDGSEGIEKGAFLTFCLNTPEIVSWIEFFDDLEEYQKELLNFDPVPVRVLSHLDRNSIDEAIMNPTTGGFSRLEIEKLGLANDLIPRKPWQNVIPFISPARLPDQTADMPAHNLSLNWVYGWNSHCSFQSIYYTSKGSIIYGSGAVCVVLNIQNGSQSYFKCHTDMVTCIKVYHLDKGDTIVASGDCGIRPSIHVWDCESKVLLSTLRGFHKNRIVQLDFSPNRELLFSIGFDIYNSVAIYKWRSRERLWASRTTTEKVYDIRFLADDLLGTCGKNHVYFWKRDTIKSFKKFRGLFGHSQKSETHLVIASVGNLVVTGSETGMLHIWEGRNLISSVRGHSGRVNAMYVIDQGDEKGLITACSSGKIQIWNSKLEIGATFNANSLGSIEPTIISVTWDLLTSKILIGFKSCEIFEMDSIDGRNIHKGSIVSGHFSPRLTGIAVHPLNPHMICSVGKDKTVRIFDTSNHSQLKMALIDTMAHSCAYSPDGQIIIIGYGSGVEGKEERKEGGYVALNEEDLTIIHEARDSKGAISDCKFSPDGKYFALASYDSSIYIYQSSNFAAKAKCRGHSSKITHFDFSTDNQFIMSNSSNGELLFWDVERGEQQAPKLMKEVQWETNSCVYSYFTQGIGSVYDDKLECLSVARSNSREIIAVTDNYGRIRVFLAPCVKEDSNYILLKGHAAIVENCKFSTDDSYLFSTGGTDGCIFQYKITVPSIQDYSNIKKDDSALGGMLTEYRFEGKSLDRTVQQINADNDNPIAISLLEESNELSSQLQPWQRTIVAPSVVPSENNSEPPDSLVLDHINGFSVDRSRKALMYSRDRLITFFSSNVGVVMDQKSRKQKFYLSHSGPITAMAIHPIESIIATGQQSETGSIRVWNSKTMDTIITIDGFHRKGICHLCFSPNGKMLGTCGFDKFHSIAIYDWANETIISFSLSFSAKSFSLEFNPTNTGLLHCGNEVIRFWELDGMNLKFQDALFGTRSKLQRFLCSGWIGNNPVVGTADGNLYRFVGRQLDGMVQAHVGAINSISSSNDGLCSAGQDGMIKIWSRILECRFIIDLKDLRAINTNARSIDWDSEFGRIIIGTMNSEIFEVSSSDGENLHGGPLMEGHSGDELFGLSSHPLKDIYATVGDDAILHVWDIFKHSAVSTIPLEMPSRCCAYAPDGRRIAIGFGSPKLNNAKQYDGKWIVLDTEDYQITHEARDSVKWLTDMKYSPNGEFFAVGSSDNKIYVYSVLNGYALNAAIGQHNAMILNLDFSEDSAWIQSNCAGMELCFFEADTGMFIPAASRLRDVSWSTQNCTMAWSVQGIWTPQKDGQECTTSDCNLFRGIDGAVVAYGDNFGRISLKRFPCTSSFSIGKMYKVSSNPISRLKFIAGDSYLISISASDKSIMQWVHNRDRHGDVASNTLDRGGTIDEDDEDIMGFFSISGKDESQVDLSEFQSIIGTRPWIAAMISPSIMPKISVDKPNYRLEKNHIFGFQSQTTRNSVRFNSKGDVIYPASRYICVYNKKSNSQIYYEGHQIEISCVGVSPDGKFSSSAEKNNRPSIHIWDASTCEVIIILPFLHRRGIVSLQFSKTNKYLLSVGQDQDHSIALWESPSCEWADGKLLAWNKGDVNPVMFASFYYNENFLFASGGRFHQKFWTLDGRSINASYAEYSEKQKLSTLLCGSASSENIFVSGSTTGNLFIWHGRKLDRVIKAHEMGITGICASNSGVVSVSKDGMIKLWSSSMVHIKSFSLTNADVPPISRCIRSVDCGFTLDGMIINRILISTMGSEVYEISTKSGSICLIQEAHFAGEVWGLGMHPTDPDIFATAGDDKTIRLWSISHKRIIRKAILDCSARCVNFSPDGRMLIVGLGGSPDGKRQKKDGAFVILDSKTLKPKFEGRDSRHWLQEVKFSPDGKLFAVGSMDHKIYLYNSNTFRLKGMCDRHNSHIKNFDFSDDSVYIQSDSGDYEHLYFEAEDGQYFASGSQLKDITWNDWTCTYGWPVQGCWPYFDDVNNGIESEPSTINRSKSHQLLCVGDYKGNVKLYNYPCLEKNALKIHQNGHVAEISKIRFSCDDKYMISIGKKDRTIISWKIMPEKSSM